MSAEAGWWFLVIGMGVLIVCLLADAIWTLWKSFRDDEWRP
jgi:cytochrome c biogenesis protein ResB